MDRGRADVLSDFFTAVWGGDQDWLGEIRCISPRGGVSSRFMPTSDPEGIARWAIECDELGTHDVYYGVVPRVTQRNGTADNCISQVTTLWADVDAKRTGGKWAGLAGIRQFALTPSVIVDSGNGQHCYWFLKSPTNWDDAQAAMKALAREVHGDAVYDKARILRVPGTHNRKDPASPKPVRILYWDIERRYRISDFPTYHEESGVQTSWRPATVADYFDLPEWLLDMIAQGAPRGSRSETCFKVVLWMLRYGRNEADILEVFRGSREGIGQKYAEKGHDGDRWLRQTIRAAQEASGKRV